MKYPNWQIARWFTLLPEYIFEICYRAGKNNAITDYLSMPVGVNLAMSNAEMDSELKVITNCLNDFASLPKSQDISQGLKKNAKNFLIHQYRLIRSTKKGLRLLPDIPTCSITLHGMHVDIGHWDFKSTYEFIASRFCWPNLRFEVSNFVRSCDVYQKTKPGDREEFQGRSIPGH